MVLPGLRGADVAAERGTHRRRPAGPSRPALTPPPPQGRDDLGRPLLQRALGIQERHLGPDHPDVLAIRDVLEEEG